MIDQGVLTLAAPRQLPRLNLQLEQLFTGLFAYNPDMCRY